MRKYLMALAASIAALASIAPAEAVTFGTPDGSAHPYVGTLLFKSATGYWSCSGTQLSPTVMITAGHCTEEGGVPNLKTWVSFAPSINVVTGCQGVAACIDAYFDNPANGWVKASAYPHQDYDDYAQWPATFDVGVIVLDMPIFRTTYAQLPTLGFLTTIRTARDNNFTVVGYGQQGEIPAFYSSLWERRTGQLKLVELNSTFDAGMTAKFTNNPGTKGGTCYGDSGGPIFYGNTNKIVAVVSWGITPCIGVDYNFRTDIPLTQDFVRSFL